MKANILRDTRGGQHKLSLMLATGSLPGKSPCDRRLQGTVFRGLNGGFVCNRGSCELHYFFGLGCLLLRNTVGCLKVLINGIVNIIVNIARNEPRINIV